MPPSAASDLKSQDAQASIDVAADTAGSSPPRRLSNALSALRLFAALLILALLSTFIAVVPVGERGILLRLGAVQNTILGEGAHIVIPVLQSVKTLSIRVQSHLQESEAATRDLQDVNIDLAAQWHIPVQHVQHVYQSFADITAIINTILTPAIEDSLKTVVASFTAEELITERARLRDTLQQMLAMRLASFDLELDGVDLVQLDFSRRFRAAVEAKQIAEQDAKRAAFEAVKAQRQAAARVYRAEGEAKAQELLQAGLSTQVLQRQAIEKWDGHLPLMMGNEGKAFIDIKTLLKTDQKRLKNR